jgi:hypothetical protein
MAGVDLRTVAELMEHGSIQMTMRYAHPAPRHNRVAIDRLVPVLIFNRSAKKDGELVQRETEVATQSAINRNSSIKIN